jgi:uncharacterized protein YjdB
MGFLDTVRDPEQTRRFRQSVLLFIILATIPCYCVGAILWGVAPQDEEDVSEDSIQATSTARIVPTSTGTITVTPTNTPDRTSTPDSGDLDPTPGQFIIRTNTPFVFRTPTPAPSASPSPTPTQTPDTNNPPQFTQVPGDMTLAVGQEKSVTFAFTDPDGDTVEYDGGVTVDGIVEFPAANQSGNEVTFSIRGVTEGTTGVFITLSDGRGGEQQTLFEVTVTPGQTNQPPVFTAEPTNMTITGGGVSQQTLQFDDPDGDIVTASVTSSNTAVATAAVSGNVMTVNGVAAGNTNITITLNDGNGGSANRTISVTVSGAANQDPIFTIEPGNMSVQVGANANQQLQFSDPDGDSVTAAAQSASPGVATASISGNTLTVTGIATGPANVTITLNDGNGGSASRTIVVTVTNANNPPLFVPPLPPGTLSIPQGDSVLQVISYDDVDGDSITYTVTSLDPNIVTVSKIDATSFTIQPGTNTGSTIVRITLNDGKGGTETHDIAVSVTAP